MARNVVVSGGGTGIGLAAARLFAADGDRVLLLGRRAEVLRRAAVPGALTHTADLSRPAEVRGVERFVARTLGTVDVLIHGAGGTGHREPRTDSVEPLDEVLHDWTLGFGLNTLTAALLTEALRDRLADPGGRVLFLGSTTLPTGSGSAAYAASKAALHPYAHHLARRLGPRGVTVNVVAPGYLEDAGFSGERPDEEQRERLIAGTPTGRPATPGDVAATLHWLASHAAGHITSQVIRVDGGAGHGH